MKKRTVLFLLLLSLMLTLPVHAADYTAELNSPKTVVGSEFLLRLSLRDQLGNRPIIRSAEFTLRYDPEKLSFLGADGGLGAPEVEEGQGELRILDKGKAAEYALRLRFVARDTGETRVELADAVFLDPNDKPLSCTLSGAGVSIAETGDDASLYSLQVVPGTLSPEFSPEIFHYRLSVPAGTEGVQVVAHPSGYYATAFVEGHWFLKDGHNSVTIDMTSAEGFSALYTIDVERELPATPTPAPTPTPTPAPIPTAAPSPTPAPTPTPKASPLPSASPIPRPSADPTPASTPVAESSPAPSAAPPADRSELEQALARLEQAESELQTARAQTASMGRVARIALVVSIAEFFLVVLLVVYIWRNFDPLPPGEDEEDEDEDNEEGEEDDDAADAPAAEETPEEGDGSDA